MKRTNRQSDQKRVQKLESADTAEAVQRGTAKLRCQTFTSDGRKLVESVLTEEVFKNTGTRSPETLTWILTQASNAHVWPDARPEEAARGTLAMLEEIGPQNVTEAMLATQMIAANDLAMMFMYRASQKEQPSEIIDANISRATRLMRVFTEQLEAMQKLRGKTGQQRVTVEHVHVHQGGQAIVGSVSTKAPGGEAGDDIENRG